MASNDARRGGPTTSFDNPATDTGADKGATTTTGTPARGGSKPSSAPAAGTRIWMVRHGQRIDETELAASFYDSEWGRTRSWDPPLTVAGMRQARETSMTQLRPLHARVHFTHVLVSPLLRTLQTAREICHDLGLPAVVVEPFCKCAAAVKDYATAHDVATAGPEGTSRRPLKAGRKARRQAGLDILHEPADIERVCSGLPMLRGEEVPAWARVDRGLSFLDACNVIAAQAAAAGVRDVMVVTHREGIRDLGARTVNRASFHHRLSTPYCCVAEFLFRRAGADAAAADAAAEAKARARAEFEAASRSKPSSRGGGTSTAGGATPTSEATAATPASCAAPAASTTAAAAASASFTAAASASAPPMEIEELDPFADVADAGPGASDAGDTDGDGDNPAAAATTAAAGGAGAGAGAGGGGGGDGDAEAEDATGMTAHGPGAWEWHLASDPAGGFGRGVRPSEHIRTPFEGTA